MLLAVVCPIFVVGVCRYEYLDALRERLRSRLPSTAYRSAASTPVDDTQLELQPLASSSSQLLVCFIKCSMIMHLIINLLSLRSILTYAPFEQPGHLKNVEHQTYAAYEFGIYPYFFYLTPRRVL